MARIKAEKNGTIATFNEGIWKTGIPSKAGWVPVEEGHEVSKVIPREIVDMSVKQTAKVTSEEVPGAVKKKDAEVAVENAEVVTTPVTKTVTPKKNAPGKQKNKAAGKRN